MGVMKWVGAIALLGGAAFLLYLYTQPAYSHRFRLTVEVQTPGGPKSGSSVIETSAWESGNWGPAEARGIRTDFRGRAVFVDLGGGRNLVALLAFGPQGTDQSKLFRLVGAAIAPGKSVDWKDEYSLNGMGSLPREYTPTFITFADLANPRTAALVDPTDLEKTFGSGFALKQVLLVTTSDPVSEGIGKIFPWWNMPNRPAEQAYRAWRRGSTIGVSLEPELLFQKE
jgi:hypothetical protein